MDLMTYLLAVKQGGGGTEVVANPEGETPSDDLESLKVGDKTYAIPEGGSSEPLIVQFEEDDEYNVTADKTFAEVDAAVKAGRLVYAKYHGRQTTSSINFIALSSGNYRIATGVVEHYKFAAFYIGDGAVEFMEVSINLNDDPTAQKITLYEA